VREKDLPGHIIGKEETSDGEKPKDKTAKKGVDTSKMSPLEKEDFQLAKAIAYLKGKQAKAEK